MRLLECAHSAQLRGAALSSSGKTLIANGMVMFFALKKSASSPNKLSRGYPRVRQPIEGDVVEGVVSGELPNGSSLKGFVHEPGERSMRRQKTEGEERSA